MITEVQAANVMGGKTARACDGCMRRRARWYCAADDAFLCQNCDASVHSANRLAGRHERVRLRTSTSSLSPSLSSSTASLKTNQLVERTTPVWYQGFTRRARTPRGCSNKGLLELSSQANNKKANGKLLVDINKNNPIVPELGNEEGSFSSTEENEEHSNFRVPVLDPFHVNFLLEEFNGGKEEAYCIEQVDDDLQGLLPSDMDLAEFALDVESLLGEDSCVDVKELGFLDQKVENNNDTNNKNDVAIEFVKDEEEEVANSEALEWNLDFGSPVFEEEKVNVVPMDISSNNGECKGGEKMKTNIFLRLNYEAVIMAWDSQASPWTTGLRPEFISPSDCWPDCLLQGHMSTKDVQGHCGGRTAVGSMSSQHGKSSAVDGEREARVSRYREKRRTRLFAKKIRYEVRKLNAEKRPRIKGRFVKRTSLLGTHTAFTPPYNL